MKTWPKVKLGDVCLINPKVAPPNANALISVVPMNAVSETGEIDASSVQPFGDVSKGLTLFQENDVLFAKITPCMENGKGAVAVGLRNGIGAGSTEFFVLRPDCQQVTSAWIYHFTKRDAFRRLAAERMTGSAGQRRVPRAFLERVPLPLPPLDEQERIVETLDAVAATLKKRRTQLAELDALVEARFAELFGDPATNPKGWAICPLAEFFASGKNAVKCGPFGGALKKEEYTSEGIPVWNMDNIKLSNEFLPTPNLWVTEDKYYELKNYDVINGDILISRAGTVGKMCVVKSSFERSVISTNLIRLRLASTLHPLYLVKLLTFFGSRICRLKAGNDDAFTFMKTGVLSEMQIPYPPLELQERFATEVERVEAIKATVRAGIAETQTLFDALTQKYFG